MIKLYVVLVAYVVVGCASSSTLPDDGYVNVPGGRAAFRVIGAGNGTPVLFIHGGPGSTSCDFVANVSGIAATRPVIVYDQLGSGYSDRIVNLDEHAQLLRFVDEVEAIREELGLKELHLFGHSWGTAVALEYLLTKKPSGIKSVVFAGPFFSTARWIADANELLKDLPPELQQAVKMAKANGNYESEGFRKANAAYWSRFGTRTPEEQLDLTACTKQPMGDSGLYKYMWGPSEFVSTGTLKDYDRIKQLSRLTLPVLLIAGEFDESRPETIEVYRQMISGAQAQVLPEAGHSMYLDQRELFNQALVAFFADVESGRRRIEKND